MVTDALEYLPDVYAAAERFRRQVLRRERSAATEMVRAYGAIWQRLKERLDDLGEQIERARERGEDVSPAWLFQQGRLSALLRQVEGELATFASYAEGAVLSAQYDVVQAAQEHAAALARAAAGVQAGEAGAAVVAASWSRLPARAVERLVGVSADGSPLREILDRLGPEASAHVRRELVAGLGAGQHPTVIARRIRAALGGNLARALTISRTEVLRAYREATRETYRANQDVVGGWEWRAAFSARTCLACLARSGQQFSLDEPMQTHPNCRCTKIPILRRLRDINPALRNVTERPIPRETGREWFDRQDYDTKVAIMGAPLYELYRVRGVFWRELVTRRRDRTWGEVWVPRPLREIMPPRVRDMYRQRAAEVALRRKTDPFWFESRDLLDRMTGVLPRLVPGIERRWSGELRVLDADDLLRGAKTPDCMIWLVRQHLQDPFDRFMTSLHELLHGHSSFDGIDRGPGWEEGLAEALTQHLAPQVAALLDVPLDKGKLIDRQVYHPYRLYVRAYERLRNAVKMSEDAFYGELIRVPIRERPGLVQQWARRARVARTPTWQQVYEENERILNAEREALRELEREEFERLWRRRMSRGG